MKVNDTDMKILEEAWKSYENEVVPHTAGPGQREDLHDTFYSGALIVFECFRRIKSEKDLLTILKSLDAELDEHMRDLTLRTFREEREH